MPAGAEPRDSREVARALASGEDGRVTIELRAKGARALIEPRFGGRLHQLFVEVGGREEGLLASPEDLAAYELEPLVGGCYPMAPWPNRIRDGRFLWAGREYRVPVDVQGEALHGTVFERPWEVVARVGGVVELACDLGPEWPWPGRAWQRVELREGALLMKLEVRAARDAFPAGCGWHPWFRRSVAGSSDARVRLVARRRYVLEQQLPTGEMVPVEGQFVLDGADVGERRLDDCFTGIEPGPVVIDWGRLRLEMVFEAPNAHVQVFTTPGSVCIEPQTCAPDAFNLAAAGSNSDGTAVVAPGRPLSAACRWSWQVDTTTTGAAGG